MEQLIIESSDVCVDSWSNTFKKNQYYYQIVNDNAKGFANWFQQSIIKIFSFRVEIFQIVKANCLNSWLFSKLSDNHVVSVDGSELGLATQTSSILKV